MDIHIDVFLLHLDISFEKNSPRFSLMEERTLNGIPSVSVAFPDGHKDTLVLNKFYANEEDRMANVEGCNFIGHLENEPEACVAMTGCVGSEDVEFTILSNHVTNSPRFKWTKDGQVIVIDSSNKVPYFQRLFNYLSLIQDF